MASTDKIDLYRLHKDQYVMANKPVLVTMDEATYLTICGRGAPGGPEFSDKVGSLYGMAFTVKMTRKFAGLQDYVVSKLEAQWWLNEESHDFGNVPKEQWNWRLMIRTPPIVGQKELDDAAKKLIEKGGASCPDQVKLEAITEGLCVQMLHVGPYEEEGRTICIMNAFVEQQGLAFHGRHHEIYLSDPRRIPPEKLKTLLRLPVRKKKR
ncbi:MAG: GyrI-like domain-containing protein [Phycisphaerales bacterium]